MTEEEATVQALRLLTSAAEFDSATGKGTGFLFTGFSADEFRATIDRAIDLYSNREQWLQVARNGMQQDYGWTQSAKAYHSLYLQVVNSKQS